MMLARLASHAIAEETTSKRPSCNQILIHVSENDARLLSLLNCLDRSHVAYIDIGSVSRVLHSRRVLCFVTGRRTLGRQALKLARSHAPNTASGRRA